MVTFQERMKLCAGVIYGQSGCLSLCVDSYSRTLFKRFLIAKQFPAVLLKQKARRTDNLPIKIHYWMTLPMGCCVQSQTAGRIAAIHRTIP
jgi:hypothetical protein